MTDCFFRAGIRRIKSCLSGILRADALWRRFPSNRIRSSAWNGEGLRRISKEGIPSFISSPLLAIDSCLSGTWSQARECWGMKWLTLGPLSGITGAWTFRRTDRITCLRGPPPAISVCFKWRAKRCRISLRCQRWEWLASAASIRWVYAWGVAMGSLGFTPSSRISWWWWRRSSWWEESMAFPALPMAVRWWWPLTRDSFIRATPAIGSSDCNQRTMSKTSWIWRTPLESPINSHPVPRMAPFACGTYPST